MNLGFLQAAIDQAVADGLGEFLDKTGVIQFGAGKPRLVADPPVSLTHRQPAAHSGDLLLFFVLMDDITRAMWRKACEK